MKIAFVDIAEAYGRPRLIYSPHGFGDRAYAFVPRIAIFDFLNSAR